MSKAYGLDRCLIFDESGNLGNSGRYFVISCIDTNNYGSLQNVMKRKIGLAQRAFPELAALHSNEIKAKDAYPAIKFHIAEVIASKDLSISYIVADLHHVKPKLLEDKNIFYNYMMRLLLTKLIKPDSAGKTIHIIYDNHTTKVGSVNSLEDYLKLAFIYENQIDVTLDFHSMDSNASDAFPVQAADYVANYLYGFYEYGDSTFFDVITKKINVRSEFPYKHFGK